MLGIPISQVAHPASYWLCLPSYIDVFSHPSVKKRRGLIAPTCFCGNIQIDISSISIYCVDSFGFSAIEQCADARNDHLRDSQHHDKALDSMAYEDKLS